VIYYLIYIHALFEPFSARLFSSASLLENPAACFSVARKPYQISRE